MGESAKSAPASQSGWLWRYFGSSFVATGIGAVIGFAFGYYNGGTIKQGLESALICLVLSVLEISLSFDNAVVNATVLQKMTPLWRHRFLTWGILLAVFGMRLIFPLAIVGIIAKVDPWSALVMALKAPQAYAELMRSIHVPVAGFGGSFLLMVALGYFFNSAKHQHWIHWVEKPLSLIGRIHGIELAIGILSVLLLSRFMPAEVSASFLTAGLYGLVTFIVVEGISKLLSHRGHSNVAENVHRASIGLFLYLEVLDASFSFDGVVGAFAITDNLFIITIGLGIGAMFVRSLTVLLVDRGTLTQYIYLENGAYYAIGALAVLMLIDTFYDVSDFVTGLIGAVLIGLSFFSSVRHNRRSGRRKVAIGAGALN